jgi:DNA-binding NarL/FixJ family response regulator
MTTTRHHSGGNREAIRLVIAENHTLIRDLVIAFLVSHIPRVRFLAEATTIAGAVRACLERGPDLLLLSLGLVAEQQDDLQRLRHRLPKLNLLVYGSSPVKDKHVILAIRNRVNGCIRLQSHASEFVTALERITRGETYFCSATTRLLSELACNEGHGRKHADQLSPRELEVFQLIADGRTSKQIAHKLGLSVATVDTHRRNLMSKIGAHNAADVIRYGHKFDLINP